MLPKLRILNKPIIVNTYLSRMKYFIQQKHFFWWFDLKMNKRIGKLMLRFPEAEKMRFVKPVYYDDLLAAESFILVYYAELTKKKEKKKNQSMWTP